MVDPLFEVLKGLKFEGAVYLDGEFTAPWCARARYGVPRSHALVGEGTDHIVSFHVMLQGHCKARMAGGGPAVELSEGDLVMFVDDDRHHLIGSDLSLPAMDADAVFARGFPDGVTCLRHGGGGEVARFVCGYLACNRRLTRPMLSGLAPMQKVRLAGGRDGAWLLDLLRVGVRESEAGRPGARAALARLSELVFIEALRRHLEDLPDNAAGWLAGLRDDTVGRAIALMHGDTAHPWRIETLAARVGSSRSALASRFVELLGESPMRYLTRHRLAKAARMLSSADVVIATVAAAVGYGSEAAFSRAFKREFGMAPAAWRKKGRETVAPRPVAAGDP